MIDVNSGEAKPPVRGSKYYRKFVLERLAKDHKEASARIHILKAHVSSGRKRKIDVGFLERLVDPVIDAPDDIHHILERQAYRRAWFNSGRFLPEAFDIAEGQDGVRVARERFVKALVDARSGLQSRSSIGPPALTYSRLVVAAIDADETKLFPLLRQFLTSQAWRMLANELKAYDSIAGRLRDLRQTQIN